MKKKDASVTRLESWKKTLCQDDIKFISTLTLYTISKPTEILKYLQLPDIKVFRKLDIKYVFNHLINVSYFPIVGLFEIGDSSWKIIMKIVPV